MIPIRYNLRSMIVRRVGAVMTILGVALTVAVFVSMLAMVQGLESTLITTGDPLNLILIRTGSQTEVNSFFDRESKGIVETMDGVETVSGEIIVLVNSPRTTGETTNIMVRGVSDKSLALRPQLKIAEGRMFNPGLREIVVSRSIATRFKNAGLGENFKVGPSEWNVVGILDTSQTAFESEAWAGYNEIAEEFDRPIYSSLLVRVRDVSAVEAVKQRIKDDRRLKFDVFSEKDYFASQTSAGGPIQYLGYLVGIIMAIGSCFAVMNTMYAATAYRTREIATLRVLGFKRWNILLSFVFESAVLSICGGLVGGLLARQLNGISTGTMNPGNFAEIVFQFQVTPGLMLVGVVFAAIVGVIGGFMPARMAARVPIVRAMRAEV